MIRWLKFMQFYGGVLLVWEVIHFIQHLAARDPEPVPLLLHGFLIPFWVWFVRKYTRLRRFYETANLPGPR